MAMSFFAFLRNMLQQVPDRLYGLMRTKSNRVKCFIAFFIILFLLYFSRSFFQSHISFVSLDCISEAIKDFEPDLQNYNGFYSKEAKFGFSGNGYIGISMPSKNLVIGLENYLDSETTIKPLVEVRSSHGDPFSAFVTDFRKGVFHLIECSKSHRKCVRTKQSIFMHRKYRNLMIQRIQINNNLDESVNIELTSMLENADVKVLDNGVTVQVYEQQFKNVVVKFVQCFSHSKLNIIPFSTANVDILTVFAYSDEKLLPIDILQQFLKSNTNDLIQMHYSQWSSIWESGLSVGPTKELDMPDALIVNSTIYFLLCSFDDPLANDDVSENNKTKLRKLIKHPDHTCFRGIPTIDSADLWRTTSTTPAVFEQVALWRLTLLKHGCSRLITVGLKGIYEAILLSIFAFQFGEDHLALVPEPNYFHRNLTVRGVTYKDCSLTIGLELYSNGTAELILTGEKCADGFNLYACSAGCINKPILLTHSTVLFQVQETKPFTALLYISESQTHLMELKKVLHVKSVYDYQANDSSNSSKKFTLPMLFWVVVASVIISFHLFLCILLYREYWGTYQMPYNKSSYLNRFTKKAKVTP